VNCTIDETSNKPYYTNVSNQFVELVKGTYGKTPIPIDPDFREQIAGVREEVPYDESSYQKQENPELQEAGGRKLAEGEKEELLLELFPAVAKPFLKDKKVSTYQEILKKERLAREAKRREEQEAYDQMSEDEKMERLKKGLYNYKWTSNQNHIDDDEFKEDDLK
jgi:pyruvate/oxaloacetate carboxyltransferase